jgi:hypothetical protein
MWRGHDSECRKKPAGKTPSLAWVLPVELLPYQFAPLVCWIEMQDLFFEQYKFKCFIGVGPSPTLVGMATRTLHSGPVQWTASAKQSTSRQQIRTSLPSCSGLVAALDHPNERIRTLQGPVVVQHHLWHRTGHGTNIEHSYRA